MKLSKFDIGAEIISIITKGMYPDPKDALREYIQNGVDASAKKMSVKIRQESIVIEDDGIGMNHETMRKAVRIGISDKSPAKNVGFMGIGIYSSFHLCGMLTIYSSGSEGKPNRLEMNFLRMKEILEFQKSKRMEGEIKSEGLIDLQTILEECISLTQNGELSETSFPNKGTRVELSRIEPEFYTALSSFDDVSDYLRNVVPLRFDKDKFKHAELIENKILEICTSKDQKFEIIDLSLQVNSKIEQLYRPYRDIDFAEDAHPHPPLFYTIETSKDFFGVAWGCLNSVRKKLDTKNLRGFVLKKQGFSIGKRESLVKFFPRGNTFFDRYSGEVIIVNQNILPNAARNDIEYSSLRSIFYEELTNVADKFDAKGHEYQELSKANEDLVNLHTEVKKEIGSYNENDNDTERLVGKIVVLKNIYDRLNNRIERKGFSEESEKNAKKLRDKVQEFEQTIQARIKVLTENKKKKQDANIKSKTELAKDVSKIQVDKVIETKYYESLFELLTDMDFKIDENFKEAIFAVDELFVQRSAKTKTEYYLLLNNLKDRIQSEE